MSTVGRRKIAVSLAGLAAVPALLLAACGNADHKVSRDDRPDPRASTEGVQSALPSPIPDDSNLDTPFNGIPPENLVSQQGVGKRK
jgi:hypothetical protein